MVVRWKLPSRFLWSIILFLALVSIGLYLIVIQGALQQHHYSKAQTSNIVHSISNIKSPTTTSAGPYETLPSSRIKIFIYNWSDDIVDRWPKRYQHKRLSTEAKFKLNDGAGPLVDSSRGLYHTHQYSLFTLFVERLKAQYHVKRSSSFEVTTSPDEAEAFFIPYDIGMDASARADDGALTATNCPKLLKVMQLLHNSPYYQRNKGRDHFVLNSINHMMLFFMNKECRKFYQLESHFDGVEESFTGCYHCAKYGIDVYDHSLFDVLKKLPEMTHNWYSIPFPSNYHFDDSSTNNPPWLKETIVPRVKRRQFAMSFIGTSEVSANKQKDLRLAIISTCRGHFPNDCLLKELNSHSSNVDFLLPSSNGSSEGAVTDHPYFQSTFCFSPGGDFPTRKGFIDAMLSGCIPITFQLATAQSQWLYHWGNLQTAMECTIYIEREEFMGNPVKTLKKLIDMSHNQTLVERKLIAIRSVAHRFQYSRPFDPGRMEDAVDVTLSHFAQYLNKR